MEVRSWLTRRPILTYYVMAYGLSWGLMLIFELPRFLRGDPVTTGDMVALLLPMLAGPSLAGLSMTALVDGRDGLRDLWARMRRWRVPARWLGAAALPVPAVLLIVLAGLTVFVSPAFTPAFRAEGIVVGLIAGFCEEIGWSGFVTPRIQKKLSPLMAGLIVGALWAVWHVLADLLGGYQTRGAWWFPTFAAQFLIPLIAYRVLMVRVYNRTQSVLLCAVMHAFYTGTLYTLSPAGASLSEGVVWMGLMTAGLWGIVLVIAAQYGPRMAAPEAEQAGRIAAAGR